MAQCAHCHSEMAEENQFCTECGRSMAHAGSGASSTSSQSSGWGTGTGSTAGHTGQFRTGQFPTAGAGSGQGADRWTGDPSTAGPGATQSQAAEVPLLAGETLLWQCRLTPFFLRPHLKTLVRLTDKRVIVHQPNTLLWLFPMGYTVDIFGHSQIEAVGFGSKTSTRRIVAGAVVLIVALHQFLLALALGNFSGGGGAAAFFVFLLALLTCGVGVLLLLSARRTGVWPQVGGNSIEALGRGYELATAREAGLRITTLATELETSRGAAQRA